MILPTGASSFTEAMKMGTEVYHHLKNVIKAKFGLDATAVGDEGGFAPNIQNNKDALDLINDAIAKAGYTGRIEIGMDVAASEFYKDGTYRLYPYHCNVLHFPVLKQFTVHLYAQRILKSCFKVVKTIV